MPRGAILHSDRGSQYCSATYQSLLGKHQLVCSMSAKGNCNDNACAESVKCVVLASITSKYMTTKFYDVEYCLTVVFLFFRVPAFLLHRLSILRL